MPYVPVRGNTLLISSGTVQDPHKKHLFILLTNACSDSQHLLVSISRIKADVHFDPACIFEAGEHGFIRERSFAAYRLARIDHSSHLIKCVDGWEFTPKADLDEHLVVRMCAGIEASDFIAERVRAYYRASIKR